MARVKRGVAAHRRHKKVLAQVKGHYSTNSRLYKRAHESMMRSLMYAYRDRRTRKRDMRRLWIILINAAARMNDITYSRFISFPPGRFDGLVVVVEPDEFGLRESLGHQYRRGPESAADVRHFHPRF